MRRARWWRLFPADVAVCGVGGMTKTALVVGATGVTGTPFTEELLRDAQWQRVYAVSRRPPRLAADVATGRLTHLAVDLDDGAATHRALAACSDVTHVFHCANHGDGATRLRMLQNVLDALEAHADKFANINLLQGTKYYGCHLGPFRTPARETDPRVPGGDFYYAEEDLVRARRRGRRWTWTAVRPHSVCGYAAGNPMNLAVVLGIYGSILKALGRPFGFPGNEACYNALFQVIDAHLLARSALWVSTHAQCANEAFNVGNGDWFRWRHLWPRLAGWFGLEPAGPQSCRLPDFLAGHRALWQQLTEQRGLRPFPYERAALWAQGDYRAPNSRMACEYDVLSDTLKIRQRGFNEVRESGEMFLAIFERCRRERVIV